MKLRRHAPLILAAMSTLWLASGMPAPAARAVPGSEADADRKACIQQLEKIHQAIQSYRRDHKDLPTWLSDLVPKYLADTNQLICPVTKRTGETHSFEQLKDPKLPDGYLYEFSLLPMGQVWAGGQIRMRDFKRRQMGLLGGEVPIVRCHLHDPVINLAFSGRIYDSGMNWEENFAEYVEFSAHQIDNLFPDIARPTTTTGRQSAPEAEEPGPEKLVGKAAPGFTLALLDGGKFDLSSCQDKDIVLLDFWATWCGPCRQAMPTLVEISRDYADKGVKYFAVNLREEPAAIRKYLKEADLNISVPLDKDGSIAKKYGVRGIPTMVIVGKDGTVKKVHVGSSPSLKSEMTRALDELLAAK